MKHVVLFRFAAEVEPAVQEREREAFRAALLELAERLPQVVTSLEIGFNTNPREQWHIALVGTFPSAEQLSLYAGHPDHLAAVGRLRPYLAGRACVDY